MSRTVTPALSTLLDSGQDFQMADLWTLTLSGGNVVRWSGADVPITANGNTYPIGPMIERGRISETRGLQVATLEMRITANADDLINGTPLIPFIAKRGLDGANVRLDRAFMANWSGPIAGTLLRFSGRVTSVSNISGSTATVTISSWAILLNANMPPNLYHTGCINTLYNAQCQANPVSFSAAVTVGASPAPTFTSFNGGAMTVSYYAQGRVVGVAGANAGISRTVKANDAAGNISLVQPFPALPVAGDTFTIYAGCDLTQATCSGKFNNLTHFRGTPYVPLPETAV